MKTILVVDDNELIRVLLSSTLSDGGFRPVAVSTGARALALIDSEPFDLLIVDFLMPGIDGAEVVRQVRRHADARVRCIPIIGLSGPDPSFQAVFDAAGADAWIAKPVKDELLVGTVTTLLGADAPGRGVAAKTQ